MIEKISSLISQLDENSNGAKFYKADLHTHTPASRCFDQDEKVTPEDFVTKAIEKGLKIIAITDHNTIDFCQPIINAAKGTTLSVFPGVEISTPQGHVLAIFDPFHPIDLIDEMLIRLGLGRTIRGNQEVATSASIDQVFEEIEKSGGVAIASHVKGCDRGFMDAITDAATKKKVYNHPCLRGLQILNPEEREEFLYGKKKGYETQKACILASDSMVSGNPNHCLDGLGNNFTYIKMDYISIEGLRQALYDPEVRIKFPEEMDFNNHPQLLALYISDGFLKDNIYNFNPSLNCFVGGKGTGKSLSFETIRFVLDQQSNLPEIVKESNSLLECELGNGGQVYLLVKKDGIIYCLVRTFPEQVVEVYKYCNSEIVKVENITNLEELFKIKAYSQSEIIELARKPAAQLSLIDDLIDLSEKRNVIKDLKEKLRRNAENLISINEELNDAQEKLENFGILQENIKILESKIADQRLKDHQQWHEEERYLNKLKKEMDLISEKCLDSVNQVIDEISISSVPDGTPNKDLLNGIYKEVTIVPELIKALKSELTVNLEKTKEHFEKLYNSWNDLFQNEEKQNKELLLALGIDGLEQTETKLNEFRKQEESLLIIKKKLENELIKEQERLIEERNNLLTNIQIARREVFAIRKQKADEITGKLENKIRVKIHQANNREQYIQRLVSMLRGSRIRSEDINVLAEKVHPIRLVKLVLAEDFQELSNVTSLQGNVMEKIVNYMLTSHNHRDLYDLQVQDLEDLVEIQFKFSDQNYKSLSKLSHGQNVWLF